MKPSILLAILSDIHFWVPLVFVALGICLLFYLR